MRCWTMYAIFLFLFTLMLIPPSRSAVSNKLPKCQDVNNTDECCPCFQETVASCEEKCPADYLLINASEQAVRCDKNSSSDTEVNAFSSDTEVNATTTITTTTVSMVTENTTMSERSEPVEGNISVQYCIKSCGDGKWYNNVSLQCENCDKSCLMCYKKDVCTVCKYEHNSTCSAECPDGFVVSKTNENGTKFCEKKKSKTEKDNTVVIAVAAGVSGAVVLITVIVIVIFCCRRHRTNKASLRSATSKPRTALSGLLEDKSKRNEEAVNKTKHRPAGYENMSQTLPSGTAIQNQGDNVLRYTKDPTATLDNKENEGGLVEEEDYGNIQMINLAKKTDLTNKAPEDMNEMLEVAGMGDAPKPPTLLPVSKGKKKTKGIVKSLSQRMSKKLGSKKGKVSQPEPEEHIPEDYMDMSGEQKSAAKPDYSVGETGTTNSSGLEDYENINFGKIPVGRKAAQKTSPQDGMEDYENPKSALSNKTQGDGSDLEDYENTKELRKKGTKKPKGIEKPGKSEEEDMEDYENTKELRLDGSKKPKGKGESDKTEGEEMEDYENMKELDLELYENVQVGQK